MKKLFFLIVLLYFFLYTNQCTAKQINILVHPFENTGDKEYSWISAGMTDTVITDLLSIQDISVVSNQDRKKVLEELKLAQSGLVEEDDKMIKIGKLTGAQVIFTGSYLISGDHIRVHARLVSVETGKVENSTKIDGTLNNIFELQDKVVLTLMSDVEKITIADIKLVKFSEQDKMMIEGKPKPKLTAYEWFAKGLEIKDHKPQEALANFYKALDIDPDYNNALIEAGYTAGSTLNLFSEGLKYLEKAKRNFIERNEINSLNYAMLMNNFGAIYWNKGQLERALEYYLKSQSINDMLGLQNTDGYAMLMNNIGSVYRNMGQFDRAMEYSLKSQNIRDGLGLQNTAFYATLMNNIGLIYWNKSQLDRALEYYLKSQTIKDGLGLQNTKGYAVLMNNIGLIYWNKSQLDRALEYYLKSQFINDEIGLQNTVFYATLMSNIALLYEKQDKRDMAGRYFKRAYDTYVKSGYSGEAIDKALNNAKRLGY